MKPTKFFRSILASFLGLFFASALTLHAASAGTAVVHKVTGMAWKVSATGAMEPLTTGSVVKQGDTIRTGIDSQVEVALGDQSRIVTLAANSTVRFEQLSIRPSVLGGNDTVQSLLKLETGSMAARGDFGEGSTFNVQMPRSLVLANGPSVSAFYDAKTGDIYNFSQDTITLTVVLNIELTNTPDFPVGLNATTVQIPSGHRFVMPTLADMDTFNSPNFAVTQIPGGITPALLQLLGFQPLSPGANPIALYRAAVLELKVLNATKRMGFIKFPPTLISY